MQEQLSRATQEAKAEVRCGSLDLEPGGSNQMFNQKYGYRKAAVLICAIIFSMSLPAATPVAPGTPKVWGYGIKSCADFVTVSKGFESGSMREVAVYLQYREWFSGLVTGLSLATANNVLEGADIKAAMHRLRLHCEEHPQDDFFQAATAYLRLLSSPDDRPK